MVSVSYPGVFLVSDFVNDKEKYILYAGTVYYTIVVFPVLIPFPLRRSFWLVDHVLVMLVIISSLSLMYFVSVALSSLYSLIYAFPKDRPLTPLAAGYLDRVLAASLFLPRCLI
ncbi:hypothetical protein HOY80DRAFT_979699 [Tuber brumale]|nr:hypothetical protein HOY80DRAFT_979699 [Tuber brumale]